MNLTAVPVLAEPPTEVAPEASGEARESNENDRQELLPADYRGGSQNFTLRVFE